MSEALIRRRVIFGLLVLPLVRNAQTSPQFIVQAVEVGADRMSAVMFLSSELQPLVLAPDDSGYGVSA